VRLQRWWRARLAAALAAARRRASEEVVARRSPERRAAPSPVDDAPLGSPSVPKAPPVIGALSAAKPAPPPPLQKGGHAHGAYVVRPGPPRAEMQALLDKARSAAPPARAPAPPLAVCSPRRARRGSGPPRG
jgi:hypothetical protein